MNTLHEDKYFSMKLLFQFYVCVPGCNVKFISYYGPQSKKKKKIPEKPL